MRDMCDMRERVQGWRDEAACRFEDPELFFPVAEGRGSAAAAALRQVNQAKAVCRRCPVRAECLRWAQDTVQDVGVWGGFSVTERREMRSRRRREQYRVAAEQTVGA